MCQHRSRRASILPAVSNTGLIFRLSNAIYRKAKILFRDHFHQAGDHESFAGLRRWGNLSTFNRGKRDTGLTAVSPLVYDRDRGRRADRKRGHRRHSDRDTRLTSATVAGFGPIGDAAVRATA